MPDHIETALIHGGVDGDERTGAVSVPIYQTSTFRQAEPGRHSGYEYSRTGNPTREALERMIAELEGGAAGFAFASGMAAITAVLMLLQSGDRVLLSGNVYGGTFRVLDRVFRQFGLKYAVADMSRAEKLEESFTPDVKAVVIESPANPLLTVTDISAAAAVARAYGALTVVDNTFMTPYLQRPLALGADIVVHSGTKYLGGHSDLIAGLAVVKDAQLAERLHFLQNATGGVLQPFDSWLLLRGIKTLAVRMDRHVGNARRIVGYLSGHPGVKRLYYPGIDGGESARVQAAQASAPGAMVSFELADGYDARPFLRAVRLITLAESLGGVESLIGHPATMTHASIPSDVRRSMGISDSLVRLSVGIENHEDIVLDLDRAFAASKQRM